MNKKIGELMVCRELLSNEQRNAILYEQRMSYDLFGEIAVKLNIISEVNLCKILCEIYDVQFVDLDYVDIIDYDILPYDVLERCCAFPFSINGYRISVAFVDPGNIDSIDEVCNILDNFDVKIHLSSRQKINRALELIKNDERRDPISIVNNILLQAVDKMASDLHFEPKSTVVSVMLRINGVLTNMQDISFANWRKIKTRLKIISNLNIAENRRPQSGHVRIGIGGKNIDLRISTHPGVFGESMVIRILNADSGVKALSELNFCQNDVDFLRIATKRSNGIFLIVGPTGSGKTTTLYSLLMELKAKNLNIMTLEDPVEYQIDGIRQMDIKDEGILSFSDGIRSILRQDPDVILVGEVRDESTASAILRASLTGRLVFTTLHSATPVEALKRLANLGMDMCEFSHQLIGIFSQRLVRSFKDGVYGERIPVCEYFYADDEVKNQIFAKDFNVFMRQTFQKHATELVNKGVTNVGEIYRVFGDGYI